MRPDRSLWLGALVANVCVGLLGVALALVLGDWRAWPWIGLCAGAAALSWWMYDREGNRE